jgi:hypothetical protein
MSVNVYLDHESQGSVYLQNNAPDSVFDLHNYDSLFHWVSQLPNFTRIHYFSYDYSVGSSSGIFTWQSPHVTYSRVSKRVINTALTDTTGTIVTDYYGLTDFFEMLRNVYGQDSTVNDILYEYEGWEPLEAYYYRNNSGERPLTRLYSTYFAPQLLFPNTGWYLGKLSRQEVYDQGHLLISETAKEYAVHTNFDHKFVPNNSSEGAVACRVRGAVVNKLKHNEAFVIGKYTMLIPHLNEVESTTIQYANGIALETSINSYYDSLHYLLSRTETLNSMGDTLATEIYYVKDFSPTLPIIGTMLEKNMHGLPLQQFHTTNSLLTGASLTTYKEDQSNVVADANYTLETAEPMSALQSLDGNGKIDALIPFEAYTEDIAYVRYDACGNLLQFRAPTGINYAIIRAYNNQYPVALISNITFAELETQMGLDMAIVNASFSQSVIREKLEDVRTTLALTQPGRFVINDPGIGVIGETDSNGKNVFYEYDAFNRLALIRDHDEHILRKFRYHYKKP